VRVFVLGGTGSIGAPTVRELVKRTQGNPGGGKRGNTLAAGAPQDLAHLYALALERAPARSSYIGAAIDGLAVGRIARAFSKRFGTPHQEPEIISVAEIAAELGEWAKGYAFDQRLSSAKAMGDLGWSPRHLDPEREIARLP